MATTTTAMPRTATDLGPLVEVMDRLLDPVSGCPWDREQTLDSLRRYLLEESFEVLAVMGQGTQPGAPAQQAAEHRDELGDLLFQIVFQSALRQRMGHFAVGDVIDGITHKLTRRHPHVFASQDASTTSVEPSLGTAVPLDAAQVEQAWHEIKAKEALARGASKSSDAVGRGLPPLLRSAKLQAHAARLGFDWPDVAGVLSKVHEELAELEAEIERADRPVVAPPDSAAALEVIAARDANAVDGNAAALAEEFGDLLFVLVRLAGHLGLSAELCLEDANRKFARRFDEVLDRCARAQLDPSQIGLAQLDAFWREVKAAGR